MRVAEFEHPVHRAARFLADWAFCDSRVLLDRRKLRELLSGDSANCGYLPTEEQCADFICGDESGRPPAKLVTDFPRTHAYLEQVWS